MLRRLRIDQQGSVSVELVITVPLLMLLVCLLFQIALWAHATHIAQAAAATGLGVARVADSAASAGKAAARRGLDRLGSGPLREVQIAVARDRERVVVQIDGTVTSLIPGVRLPVRAEAAGPVERLTLPRGTGATP